MKFGELVVGESFPRHPGPPPEVWSLDPKIIPKTPLTSGGMTGCLGILLCVFGWFFGLTVEAIDGVKPVLWETEKMGNARSLMKTDIILWIFVCMIYAYIIFLFFYTHISHMVCIDQYLYNRFKAQWHTRVKQSAQKYRFQAKQAWAWHKVLLLPVNKGAGLIL